MCRLGIFLHSKKQAPFLGNPVWVPVAWGKIFLEHTGTIFLKHTGTIFLEHTGTIFLEHTGTIFLEHTRKIFLGQHRNNISWTTQDQYF